MPGSKASIGPAIPESWFICWYDDDGVTHVVWGPASSLFADARCRHRWDPDTYECIGRYAPPETPPVTCLRCVAGLKAGD